MNNKWLWLAGGAIVGYLLTDTLVSAAGSTPSILQSVFNPIYNAGLKVGGYPQNN